MTVVAALKTTEIPLSDGNPGLYLDGPGAEDRKKSGGFQTPYELVNVTAMRFQKDEQARCIFGFTPAEFKKTLGASGTKLLDAVKEKVKDHWKVESLSLHQVHVLFHWNDHSFFKYHQDNGGDVAVVVNLSPACKTDFHIAGGGEAWMKTPGAAHMFPTSVFHRSGTAPRRCIKFVFFWSIVGNSQVVDVEGAGAGPSGVDKAAEQQPITVKPEPPADPGGQFQNCVSEA